MDVTIESNTLFEAYEAAENEQAKSVLRDAIVTAEPDRSTHGRDLETLYPETDVDDIGLFGGMEVEVDAEEIIAELEEDDTEAMPVKEAKEYLNEQADFGSVIKTEGDNDLYVAYMGADIKKAIDQFSLPDGWTAEPQHLGIAFNRVE